jgi:hypothetical protein
MKSEQFNNLRYPIGHFKPPEKYTSQIMEDYKINLLFFPTKLRKEVEKLTDAQLDTTYRVGGWTIRQIVHHLADSQINAYVRFKLALTEEQPFVKPYYEDKWAKLEDSLKLPIEPSLKILEGIHHRWAFMIDQLSVDERNRTFIQPEEMKAYHLKEHIARYVWHGQHHLAHIVNLKKDRGWFELG